jgi:EmrB/QacA subfamily drug resistance transporter
MVTLNRSSPSKSAAQQRMIANPYMAIVAVGLGTLIVPLDSAVNIAFPHITQAFGISINAIQWVVICYVLTYSSLMLVFGKLGDLFGHRRMFRIGLAISIVAFVLCGSTSDFGWLLFFRFCQGVGAALVISCSPALATACFPEEQRAKALGIYTALFGLGSVIGPSLGGLMVEAWGWSAVFWFRAPLSILALGATIILPDLSERGSARPFDILGACLLALALSGMLLTLNRLQDPGAETFTILALAGVSVLSFAGFVWQEGRFPEPIIKLQVFRDIDFSILNATNFTMNLVGFSVMLFVPYFLVRVAGYPTWLSGFVLGCAPLGVALAGPIGGWTIGRVAANRLAFCGVTCLVTGLFAIGTWHDGTALPLLVATLILHGLGLGLFQISYMHIVTGVLSKSDRGVAGSLTMVTRSAGVVTGVTVLSWMFASAGGADQFLPAFQSTFHQAAFVILVFLGVSLLRPGIWFRARKPG